MERRTISSPIRIHDMNILHEMQDKMKALEETVHKQSRTINALQRRLYAVLEDGATKQQVRMIINSEVDRLEDQIMTHFGGGRGSGDIETDAVARKKETLGTTDSEKSLRSWVSAKLKNKADLLTVRDLLRESDKFSAKQNARLELKVDEMRASVLAMEETEKKVTDLSKQIAKRQEEETRSLSVGKALMKDPAGALTIVTTIAKRLVKLEKRVDEGGAGSTRGSRASSAAAGTRSGGGGGDGSSSGGGKKGVLDPDFRKNLSLEISKALKGMGVTQLMAEHKEIKEKARALEEAKGKEKKEDERGPVRARRGSMVEVMAALESDKDAHLGTKDGSLRAPGTLATRRGSVERMTAALGGGGKPKTGPAPKVASFTEADATRVVNDTTTKLMEQDREDFEATSGNADDDKIDSIDARGYVREGSSTGERLGRLVDWVDGRLDGVEGSMKAMPKEVDQKMMKIKDELLLELEMLNSKGDGARAAISATSRMEAPPSALDEVARDKVKEVGVEVKTLLARVDRLESSLKAVADNPPKAADPVPAEVTTIRDPEAVSKSDLEKLELTLVEHGATLEVLQSGMEDAAKDTTNNASKLSDRISTAMQLAQLNSNGLDGVKGQLKVIQATALAAATAGSASGGGGDGGGGESAGAAIATAMVEGITTEVGQMQAAVRLLQERVSRNEEMSAKDKAALDSALEASVNALNTSVKSLKGLQVEGIVKIEERVARVDNQFKLAEGRIKSLESDISALQRDATAKPSAPPTVVKEVIKEIPRAPSAGGKAARAEELAREVATRVTSVEQDMLTLEQRLAAAASAAASKAAAAAEARTTAEAALARQREAEEGKGGDVAAASEAVALATASVEKAAALEVEQRAKLSELTNEMSKFKGEVMQLRESAAQMAAIAAREAMEEHAKSNKGSTMPAPLDPALLAKIELLQTDVQSLKGATAKLAARSIPSEAIEETKSSIPDDVAVRLETLERRVAEVGGAVGKLDTDALGDVDKRIDSRIEEQVTLLHGSMDTLQDTFTTAIKEVAARTGTVMPATSEEESKELAESRARLAELEETLQSLQDEMKRLAVMNASKRPVSAALAPSDRERISSLATEIQSTNAVLDDLRHKAAAGETKLNETIGTVAEDLVRLQTTLGRVTSQPEVPLPHVRALQEDVSALRCELKSLGEQKGGSDPRLDRVLSDMSKLEHMLQGVVEKTPAQDGTMKELQGEMVSLRGMVEELQKRPGGDKLDSLAEDVARLDGLLTEAKLSEKDLAAALASDMESLAQQIRRLDAHVTTVSSEASAAARKAAMAARARAGTIRPQKGGSGGGGGGGGPGPDEETRVIIDSLSREMDLLRGGMAALRANPDREGPRLRSLRVTVTRLEERLGDIGRITPPTAAVARLSKEIRTLQTRLSAREARGMDKVGRMQSELNLIQSKVRQLQGEGMGEHMSGLALEVHNMQAALRTLQYDAANRAGRTGSSSAGARPHKPTARKLASLAAQVGDLQNAIDIIQSSTESNPRVEALAGEVRRLMGSMQALQSAPKTRGVGALEQMIGDMASLQQLVLSFQRAGGGPKLSELGGQVALLQEELRILKEEAGVGDTGAEARDIMRASILAECRSERIKLRELIEDKLHATLSSLDIDAEQFNNLKKQIYEIAKVVDIVEAQCGQPLDFRDSGNFIVKAITSHVGGVREELELSLNDRLDHIVKTLPKGTPASEVQITKLREWAKATFAPYPTLDRVTRMGKSVSALDDNVHGVAGDLEKFAAKTVDELAFIRSENQMLVRELQRNQWLAREQLVSAHRQADATPSSAPVTPKRKNRGRAVNESGWNPFTGRSRPIDKRMNDVFGDSAGASPTRGSRGSKSRPMSRSSSAPEDLQVGWSEDDTGRGFHLPPARGAMGFK